VSDELVATELIFENRLKDLPPEEIVALLSCLIFEEKGADQPGAFSESFDQVCISSTSSYAYCYLY
jgi:superfamily II RNA helicase